MIYALMGYLHTPRSSGGCGAIRALAGESGAGDGRVRRPDPARLAADGRDGRGDERVQRQAGHRAGRRDRQQDQGGGRQGRLQMRAEAGRPPAALARCAGQARMRMTTRTGNRRGRFRPSLRRMLYDSMKHRTQLYLDDGPAPLAAAAGRQGGQHRRRCARADRRRARAAADPGGGSAAQLSGRRVAGRGGGDQRHHAGPRPLRLDEVGLRRHQRLRRAAQLRPRPSTSGRGRRWPI